jgi:hypothetical protein
VKANQRALRDQTRANNGKAEPFSARVTTDNQENGPDSYPNPLDHDPATAPRPWHSWLGALPLSFLMMVGLLGSLIYAAGPWAVIANTRLLNLLIMGGFVRYHDRQAGFVQGLAHQEYYVKAQDPIAWTLIAIVIGLYLLTAGLNAVQFHIVAVTYGLLGTLGRHARAYFYGFTYRELLPFNTGDAAMAAAMQAEGAALPRTRATLFALGLFFLFEVAVFALFDLFYLGWAAWFYQLLCSLLIVGVLYWWTRPSGDARAAGPGVGLGAVVGAHLQALTHQPLRLLTLCLLSLLVFGLHDLAAYLTTMAFSTQHVLLNIAPSLILMGVIGGYVASYIRLTPGGIGQFEWGFAAALFIGGVGLPEAATVALLVNFFRYVALAIIWVATLLWFNTKTSFQGVLELMGSAAWRQPVLTDAADADAAPATPAWLLPAATVLWQRALIVAWVALTIFFVDQLTVLLADRWLLESLQLGSVFRTNFGMGAWLFVAGTLLFGAAVVLPALRIPNRVVRRFFLSAGGLVGLLAGYLLAGQYLTLLPLFTHAPFGEVDPVFRRDISFYVFVLPALWTIWQAVLWVAVVALVSAGICAYLVRQETDARHNRLLTWLSVIGTPTLRGALALVGIVAAVGVWLTRYELLFVENKDASVFNGAAYLDVTGFFSILNAIQLTALLVVAVLVLLTMTLGILYTARHQGWQNNWRSPARRYVTIGALLIALDFLFAGAVAVRDVVAVTPNQPVIQLPYIQRHVDATRKAYGMDRIEEVTFTPNGKDAPLPTAEALLASPTIKNAPLWPTFVNYLEKLVDPQHAQRILQTGGDNMIYGPTLENFRQQQKLRTYYNFLSLSPMRFTIAGEPQVFAASVRELPILEPQPWLAWWGQRFMLFTHGHGMVMAPVAEVDSEGGPRFVSSDIPVRTAYPELAVQNQQIYYGAGNASMAVSNVRDMAELDYPTEQGRAVNTLPPDSLAGVPIDSLLKRFVFGWRSGEFPQILFSSLITPETRLHFYRQPLVRLARIAPFLFIDNNPYPALVDGEIVWLINAVTTTDRYPYSKREDFGDKSMSRSPDMIETRLVNYVEDSVKITLNAATGQVAFYQIADKPVVQTWARIYPELFTAGEAMPAGVRQQLTYPVHLFHIIFDDVYIYYHMNDAMYFFNMEDMWDDADEVLGPLLDQGKAITFSMEPNHVVLETGGPLPASAQGHQFAMTMAFTPEGTRNLRAIPIVYQDGEDYGRLIVLQVPKGHYVLSPEQADSLIDQDPAISQQISWWNRRGTEVIRGHTSLLLVGNELLYVEPIFIRSQQNSMTQLKRVVVVFREQAYMAETLEEALRQAIAGQRITPEVALANP